MSHVTNLNTPCTCAAMAATIVWDCATWTGNEFLNKKHWCMMAQVFETSKATPPLEIVTRDVLNRSRGIHWNTLMEGNHCKYCPDSLLGPPLLLALALKLPLRKAVITAVKFSRFPECSPLPWGDQTLAASRWARQRFLYSLPWTAHYCRLLLVYPLTLSNIYLLLAFSINLDLYLI